MQISKDSPDKSCSNIVNKAINFPLSILPLIQAFLPTEQLTFSVPNSLAAYQWPVHLHCSLINAICLNSSPARMPLIRLFNTTWMAHMKSPAQMFQIEGVMRR